jgi:hypothetical protein
VEDSGGGLELDEVFVGAGVEDGGVGAEVDGGVADGGDECGGELAGVDAVLVEEDELMMVRIEGGEELSEFFGGDNFVGCGGWWEGLEGLVGLERDADTGEMVEAV